MAMDATTLLTSQFGAAAGSQYLLNLLQKWSKTPWINEHTTGINIAVRAALAFGATVGITWAWSPTISGGHMLSIAIPSVVDLGHGLWHWFDQYAMTHIVGSILGPKSLPQANGPQA